MKKKNLMILFLILVTAVTVFSFVKPQVVYAQSKDAEPTASVQQTSAVTATDSKDQHIFSWAVFLIAVGEFAGLIAHGLSSMHKERRREKQAQKQPEKLVGTFTYDEHKKGLYSEAEQLAAHVFTSRATLQENNS